MPENLEPFRNDTEPVQENQQSQEQSFRLYRGVDIIPPNSSKPQQLTREVPLHINPARPAYDKGDWL